MNPTDSLITHSLSEINTNLSAINDNLLASNHNSMLGVSWDILLPALISIAIFIIGYIITGLQARRRVQKSRILVKDTIVTWADANFESLDKYVQSVKDLADRIGKSDSISPESFAIQHLTIDVLTQFSIDRLTDALVAGLPQKVDKAEKSAKLNAYMTSVSYLVRGQNIVMEQYENYHSSATNLLNQWEKKWNEFMENCDMNTLRHLNMPTTPEKLFYAGIAAVYPKVNDNDLSKISTGKGLITGIENVIKNQTIITKEVIDTSYIFRELKSLLAQIEDVKLYKQLFLDDVDKIVKGIERFRSAIDFYREQEMKTFA